MREFKRRVGDDVPIAVGALSLPAEDVFATMARWVADRAEEREGAPPSDIILSHPASWGGHRTQLILAALASKDLTNVTLISEPEAAALHYAAQVRVEAGSTIAVYDLGGGTFDTAVLKKTHAGHFEMLGRPEGIEGLGGADFDAAILRYVADHAGQGLANLDRRRRRPGGLSRLRRECVEAKEALSADSEASISVLLPGIQQQVRLVRSDFEAMISEPIRETVDALERSLQDLGLTPDDLSAVLLIGGSSHIPLVAQLISEQLDRPIAVDADPKSSTCLGAAVAALRAQPEGAPQPAALTAQLADAVVLTQADGHHGAASRRASWSRHADASAAALAAGAHAAGAHAAGRKGGAHGPRSTVRLTAVAAVAALFTGLTATAAQSPDGLGSLSAMFAPPADAAKDTPSAAPPDGTGGPGSGGPAAGAGAAGAGAGAAQLPVQGIEASAQLQDSSAPPSSTGLDVAASSTHRAPTEAGQPAAGGAAAGTVTSGEPAQGSGGSTPDPVTNPTTDPAADPVPLPVDPLQDPTTDPARALRAIRLRIRPPTLRRIRPLIRFRIRPLIRFRIRPLIRPLIRFRIRPSTLRRIRPLTRLPIRPPARLPSRRPHLRRSPIRRRTLRQFPTRSRNRPPPRIPRQQPNRRSESWPPIKRSPNGNCTRQGRRLPPEPLTCHSSCGVRMRQSVNSCWRCLWGSPCPVRCRVSWRTSWKALTVRAWTPW
ncbi:heat shock cognate 70 kDa protein [Arthrobacter sp. Hiyo4]|nr:heat shock cognate 70 kDa protein [Arthrobacter sp. Hiyo4]